MRLKLLSLFIALFVLLVSANYVSATSISSCAILNDSSQYELTTDLIDQTGILISGNGYTCFYMAGNGNILFDCQGHLIDGQGAGTSRGIWMDGTSNVTFKNCVVKDWDFDVLLGGSGNWIYNLTFSSSGYGLYLTNSGDYNTINKSVFDSSTSLTFMNGATGNVIENNIFLGSAVNAYASSGNVFYRNIFNGTGLYYATGGGNLLNTIPFHTSGGGNSWVTPEGTGFSQTCNDSKCIGYCNQSYTPSTYGTDYFPVSGCVQDPSIYKQSVKVNFSENVTNYQLKLLLTNQTVGFDWDWRFACYGKYRFTDKTETKNLSYFQESCNSSTQKLTVWFKGNFTTLNGTQAYIRYGNLDWASESNADNVFIFYDGFSRVTCNPFAEPNCNTTINLTKWNGTGRNEGGSFAYGCFKEYFGRLSCYGTSNEFSRYLQPNVMFENNTLIEYVVQYVTKPMFNLAIFLPYVNESRISVNGQTGGQNFQGRWSGGLAQLGDDLGYYNVTTLLRGGVSLTNHFTNVTVPNGTTVSNIYQLEEPSANVTFPTTYKMEFMQSAGTTMQYNILSPFRARKYLVSPPSIDDSPPSISFGQQLNASTIEEEEQPAGEPYRVSVISDLLTSTGSGLGNFLSAITDPLVNIILGIGAVVAVVLIVFAFSGAVKSVVFQQQT